MRIKDILNEDENPCWDGYEMIGMKEKDGKEVPNCVPKNEIKEDLNEGIITIVLGVAGAVLLLKILKKVAKVVLGGIGLMVKLPKDKLKEAIREMCMEFIKKDPRNSMEAAKLQHALESAVDDGDITTMKDVVVIIKKLKDNGTIKLREGKFDEYADALEKTKEVDPDELDEANLASTLKSDVAKELKVSPNSLSVGEAFTPKKTKDGNRIVVIGLDTKVKNVSIPQADYFGKEITNGGYLIVKANASSGKLMKVLGRVKDRRDIKLSDYVNETISRSFTKAAENYQKEQLKLQDIVDKQEDVVKRFKKASGKEKERLKKDIVKLHRDQKEQMKKVHDAEAKFEKALNNEPVELEEGALNESTSTRLTNILEDLDIIGESLKKGDKVKIKQGHDKTANGRTNLSGKSGVITAVHSTFYSVDVPSIGRKFAIQKDDVIKESTGCSCGCDGKKKVNEKYNVNLKTGKYDIGASQHATGTFFYNRKEEENGDYKNIAKVQNGKVTFLDKNLPNKVKTHIEKYVKQNESLSEDVTVVDRQHNIGKVTDERGDDWYVKKIDSTHMYMANDPKYLKKDRPSGVMAHHIGQHRDAPYYSDLRSWLKESVNEAKLDKKDIVFKEKAPSGYFRVVAKRNSSGRGKQDKFSMYIIDKSGDIKQGWGSHSSLSGAKKFLKGKDYDPNKSGDGIFDGVNEAVRPSKTIEKFQKVIDDSQRQRIGGVMVDLTTANMVMQVYNQTNDRMKEKLNKLSSKKLIDLVFKLVK